MRKIKLLIMVAVLLGAAACKKTYTPPVTITTNVTNAEAADMAAGAVSLNSNGVANVSDDAAITATAYVVLHLPCGTTKSDSLSRQSAPGAEHVYSYSLKYSYTLNCNNNVPDNLVGSLIYGGNFSGPHLSSANSGTANFTIAGLSPTANNYVINGEYKRAGIFQSKIDTTNHGSSTVAIVLTALTLKKTTRVILSGTGTITITGTVPKKGAFSYTGALVFNGDGTAKLTVNGTVYHIDLTTGVRTKV